MLELKLMGYGDIPQGKTLEKDEVYTLIVNFKSFPRVDEFTYYTMTKVKPKLSIVKISGPSLDNNYNLSFKISQNVNLNDLINSLEFAFIKWGAKVKDLEYGKKEIQNEELYTPVAKVEKYVGEIKESVIGYLPSLSTLKWIGIAAGVGVVLFYVGPLLRAGGKMIEKRV